MQDTTPRYVSIPPVDAADVEIDSGTARLTVERTIVDLVADLDRAEDLDAVIRTACRHGLTTAPRLRRRARELAEEANPHAAAVLESLGRIETADN